MNSNAHIPSLIERSENKILVNFLTITFPENYVFKNSSLSKFDSNLSQAHQ